MSRRGQATEANAPAHEQQNRPFSPLCSNLEEFVAFRVEKCGPSKRKVTIVPPPPFSSAAVHSPSSPNKNTAQQDVQQLTEMIAATAITKHHHHAERRGHHISQQQQHDAAGIEKRHKLRRRCTHRAKEDIDALCSAAAKLRLSHRSAFHGGAADLICTSSGEEADISTSSPTTSVEPSSSSRGFRHMRRKAIVCFQFKTPLAEEGPTTEGSPTSSFSVYATRKGASSPTMADDTVQHHDGVQSFRPFVFPCVEPDTVVTDEPQPRTPPDTTLACAASRFEFAHRSLLESAAEGNALRLARQATLLIPSAPCGATTHQHERAGTEAPRNSEERCNHHGTTAIPDPDAIL